MKFSYENENLTAEVMQDLAEFGANLKVIAIYSVFPEAPDRLRISANLKRAKRN